MILIILISSLMEIIMTAPLIDLANRILQEQSFSRLLGAEVIHVETGKISIALPVRNDFFQQNGFIHGGILSYLADNSITFAGGLVLGPSVLTAEYKINYLKPAGQFPLISHAEVIQSGKSLAICQCRIYSETNKGDVLVAIAQGTIMKTDPN